MTGGGNWTKGREGGVAECLFSIICQVVWYQRSIKILYRSHVISKLISKSNIIRHKICLLNVMFCETPYIYIQAVIASLVIEKASNANYWHTFSHLLTIKLRNYKYYIHVMIFFMYEPKLPGRLAPLCDFYFIYCCW